MNQYDIIRNAIDAVIANWADENQGRQAGLDPTLANLRDRLHERLVESIKGTIKIDPQVVLDSFAINAPPAPDWFEPVLDPAPNVPSWPSTPEDCSHMEFQEFLSWRQDPVWDFDSDNKKLVEKAREFEEYDRARLEYKEHKKREHMLQWPYAYAIMQMERRGTL